MTCSLSLDSVQCKTTETESHVSSLTFPFYHYFFLCESVHTLKLTHLGPFYTLERGALEMYLSSAHCRTQAFTEVTAVIVA